MTESVYGEYHNPKWIPKTSIFLMSMVGAIDHLTEDKTDPRLIETMWDVMAYSRLLNIQEYGPSQADCDWLEFEAKSVENAVKDKYGKEISRIREKHNLEDPSAKPSGLIVTGGSYNKREDSTNDDSIERKALDAPAV